MQNQAVRLYRVRESCRIRQSGCTGLGSHAESGSQAVHRVRESCRIRQSGCTGLGSHAESGSQYALIISILRQRMIVIKPYILSY